MSTILIIDDAEIMRMRLQAILENNMSCITASNGIEGVKKYEESHPDLVTLDISMPEMDGIETLEEIMKNDPNAKVVMVSAVGQKQLVLKALSLGAKDFVVKPFDSERVLNSLNKLL